MDKFVKEKSIWSAHLEEKKHLFTICDIASAKNVPRVRTGPESRNLFSSDTSSKYFFSILLFKQLSIKNSLLNCTEKTLFSFFKIL